MPWGKADTETEKVVCSEVSVPDIYIEAIPRQKIGYLMEEYPHQEWLAYLVGKKSDHEKFFVEDISIPPHTESSMASAEAEPFHIPDKCIGIIHSHHRMGAFHSATDRDYVDKNFPVSITVAFGEGSNLAYDALSYQITPCGKRIVLDCTVKYVQPPPLFNKDKFLNKAKENIEKAHKVSFVSSLKVVPSALVGYEEFPWYPHYRGVPLPQTAVRAKESSFLRMRIPKIVTQTEIQTVQDQAKERYGFVLSRAEAEDIILNHPEGIRWLEL